MMIIVAHLRIRVSANANAISKLNFVEDDGKGGPDLSL